MAQSKEFPHHGDYICSTEVTAVPFFVGNMRKRRSQSEFPESSIVLPEVQFLPSASEIERAYDGSSERSRCAATAKRRDGVLWRRLSWHPSAPVIAIARSDHVQLYNTTTECLLQPTIRSQRFYGDGEVVGVEWMVERCSLLVICANGGVAYFRVSSSIFDAVSEEEVEVEVVGQQWFSLSSATPHHLSSGYMATRCPQGRLFAVCDLSGLTVRLCDAYDGSFTSILSTSSFFPLADNFSVIKHLLGFQVADCADSVGKIGARLGYACLSWSPSGQHMLAASNSKGEGGGKVEIIETYSWKYETCCHLANDGEATTASVDNATANTMINSNTFIRKVLWLGNDAFIILPCKALHIYCCRVFTANLPAIVGRHAEELPLPVVKTSGALYAFNTDQLSIADNNFVVRDIVADDSGTYIAVVFEKHQQQDCDADAEVLPIVAIYRCCFNPHFSLTLVKSLCEPAIGNSESTESLPFPVSVTFLPNSGHTVLNFRIAVLRSDNHLHIYDL